MSRIQLQVDMDPELRQKVKIRATMEGMSVKDWVTKVIVKALNSKERENGEV